MANSIFAFPNRVDATFYTVSFSGGTWQAALPLTNLRDPLLQNVARSNGISTAVTKFTVDLGAQRDVLVLAIPKGSWSQLAQCKITGATDSGFTNIVSMTDWFDIWGTVYEWESIPFEHPSWWTGKVPPEDAENYPQPMIVVLDTPVNARYWKFEFDDTTNADGYLDLARLIIAPGWQPTVNFSYGAQINWRTTTQVQESLGGVRYYDPRPQFRTLKVQLDTQDLDELLQNYFEAERQLGIDLQLMFVYDPDDTNNLARRSFLATFERLNPVTETFYNHASSPVELVEVI